MHTLTNWSVKRSGPCMTIKGIELGQSHVKLTSVYEVKSQAGRVLAFDGVGRLITELVLMGDVRCR